MQKNQYHWSEFERTPHDESRQRTFYYVFRFSIFDQNCTNMTKLCKNDINCVIKHYIMLKSARTNVILWYRMYQKRKKNQGCDDIFTTCVYCVYFNIRHFQGYFSNKWSVRNKSTFFWLPSYQKNNPENAVYWRISSSILYITKCT